MDAPSPTLAPDRPKRRHRPRDGMGLWVTDGELVDFLGVPARDVSVAIAALERFGFPKKQAIWGDRRYLPDVRAFLDKRYGLNMAASPRRSSDE